jgi:hypothetical protein
MRAIKPKILIPVLAVTLFFSCNKTDDFTSESLSDYVSPQVGKYITYRLDSTVFTNFGTTTEVHSFEEKHVVDAQIPDAMGRPSYRILRYLRDVLATKPWTQAGSYFITPLDNTLELVENNLRFVKLATPIKEGLTWKGNKYLPDEPFLPLYDFQNDNEMEEWDFSYGPVNETMSFNGQTLNIITVNGFEDATNVPVTAPDVYGSIDYHQYKYAKGIGLVFEEWIMWDYQPPSGMATTGNKKGFGVKRVMIDHN